MTVASELSQPPAVPAQLLNERDAARYCNISPLTLHAMRYRPSRHRPGPPYIKLGRTVRYRLRDLDTWIRRNRIDPAGK